MNFRTIIIVAISLSLSASPVFSAENHTKELKFRNVLKQFENPGKEFRTAPLWVWNTTVTEADIDRMFAEYKDQGFGGVFVHPRPGLETEYLSDEWFRLWRYSVEKGKELGLDVWIYDENSYPSGFAGGHVPEQMPESYNQGIGLKLSRLQEAPKPGEHYMCLLHKGDNFEVITEKLSELQGQKGDYYAYDIVCGDPSAWTGGYPYTDLIAKGVTEKFIKITMSGYEKEFGSELGTVIKGIFTDEPNLVHGSKGIRWTPDLFDTFQNMFGYDLRPNWPLLTESSPRGDKLRHDYYLALHNMFVERWSKPWNKYTQKHKLLWTGHYWEHAWPAINGVQDNMAMYVWHQMPAIDMLLNNFNTTSPGAQFGNVRSVKELASVANQMGRVRTLSETYGAGGWDERFQDFKRLGDWEYVLGVNFMNQHLSHMTITGARKYDYPPEFTSIEPWWKDYGVLNDYFARLSLVLSQGNQINDWLILEPTTTLWISKPDGKGNNPGQDCANVFQDFLTNMETSQMEYDLGSENTLKDIAKVKGKGLRIKERTYGTVIIPPGMKNIESSTLNLLKKFVSRGGRLIAVERPSLVNGQTDEQELYSLFNNSSIIKCNGWQDVLRSYNELSVSGFSDIQGSLLFHHRRRFKDGQLIFAVNSSLEEGASAKLSIPGKYLYLIDPMGGRSYSCDYSAEAGNVSTEIYLEPAGSVMYFASDHPLDGVCEPNASIVGETVPAAGELNISAVSENIMNIDFCRLQVNDMVFPELFTKDACNEMWKCFGWNSDPWDCQVQFKRELIEKDNFPPASISADYHFMVTDDIDLSNLHFIIEKPWLWRVLLNGNELVCVGDTLLDSRCGDYRAAGYAVKGDNVISLQRAKMSIYAELAPVMVLGDFGVYPATPGWTIGKAPEAMEMGSWAQQGYPEYPWSVSYSKKYDIGSACSFAVKLNAWNGTVSEVWINGTKSGIIAFPPYILDVSGDIKPGMNTVEVRVVGSMKNLYGPHNTRKRGGMWSSDWNGVGQNHLPGSEYDLFPYGLEEDFELVKLQ